MESESRCLSTPKMPKKKHRHGSVPRLSPLPAPIVRPPPSLAGSGSERSSTPSSASSSPKTTTQPLCMPHGTAGDLLNDFPADFDATKVTFCFQCATETPNAELTLTVERTGYRLVQPLVNIYRPVYSCPACLRQLTARKEEDPQQLKVVVRLAPSALELYAYEPRGQ